MLYLSAAAISALPREAFNLASLAFESVARFEGIPFSAYLDFVSDEKRMLVYAVEIPVRGLSGAGTSATTLYAATQDITTEAGDTPAQTLIIGTMTRSFTLKRSIDINGGLQLAVGTVELNNLEADYDDAETDYAIEGEEITLKVMEAPAITAGTIDYGSAYTVGKFIVSGKSADMEKFTLNLMDKSYMLDVPAQISVFSGVGAAQYFYGGPELAGKRRPWALGWVYGVTPTPTDPVRGLYMASYRSVQAISAVYDSGVLLDDFGDVSGAILTDVTFGTASLHPEFVPGMYATCADLGLIRLAGSPFGQVTCDIEGDNVGGFVETTAEIVERIVDVATELASSEIADNSIDILATDQPAPVGYYIGHEDNETVSQVVGKLMNGIGGYAGFSRLGLFEVHRIDAPGIVPAARYDDIAAVAINRAPLPDELDPPPHRFRVAYARNWTILSSVAGEETDSERAAYLKSPYKVASTSDVDGLAILADHPFAKDEPPIEAYFREPDHAQEEVDRLLELHSAYGRALWSITLKGRPFVHDILQTIHVTKDRFDLGDGKMMRLLSVGDVLSGEGDTQQVTALV